MEADALRSILPPCRLMRLGREDNAALLEWLNDQPSATPLTCLGDGHDWIGNLFAQVSGKVERREIQGLAFT